MTAGGIVLLVLGAVIAATEAHVPTHGASGTVGVLMMGVGVALAMIGVGASALVGVLGGVVLTVGTGSVVVVAVKKGLAARRRRVRTGAEGLIGQIGVVRSWSDADGTITLHGAVWQARRSLGFETETPPELHTGDKVVVERLTGLTVTVRPAEEWELI